MTMCSRTGHSLPENLGKPNGHALRILETKAAVPLNNLVFNAIGSYRVEKTNNSYIMNQFPHYQGILYGYLEYSFHAIIKNT